VIGDELERGRHRHVRGQITMEGQRGDQDQRPGHRAGAAGALEQPVALGARHDKRSAWVSARETSVISMPPVLDSPVGP
jgi:hypothetical protein